MLSLLLLVALVTTTQLDQGLIIVKVVEPPHQLNNPSALVKPSMPYSSMQRQRAPVHYKFATAQSVINDDAAAVTAISHYQPPSSPLPTPLSSSLAELLQPVLIELATLIVFQVIGIPLLSKVFAMWSNIGVGASLASRLPSWLKVKDVAHWKHVWSVVYHAGRPPLRMLRKAQKFIKHWYGPHLRRQRQLRMMEREAWQRQRAIGAS
jgi:hypothetical protein